MTTVQYAGSNGTSITIDYADIENEMAAGSVIATITVSNDSHTISAAYLGVSWTATDGDGNSLDSNFAYSTDNGTTLIPYSGGVMVEEASSYTFQLVLTEDIVFSDYDIDTLDLYPYVDLDDYSNYDEFDPIAAEIEESEVVNTAPTDLTLSANAIAEDTSVGTVIGELSATDVDGDTLTYTLDDDADGRFELVTENGVTKVVLSGTLDYETAAAHEVSVSVTDGEHTTNETFTITVGDVAENTAPTDIEISNDTLKESARVGFVVGVLSATDAEGDTITWTLESGEGDNDDRFSLVVNDDGTVSVVLKNAMDHESTSGGVYDLVVTATDANGASTTQTLSITAEEEYFKLSSSPTGYNYASVTEAAEKGQEIGYVMEFDDSFVPVNGKFDLKTRVVDGETRYYIVTNGTLDYEKKDSYTVSIEATDAAGVTATKTFEIKVLDAVESGDAALGTITIDANTLTAAENGGINWNTYLEDYWSKLDYWLPNFLPSGSGWTSEDAASEFVYGNGESYLSIMGSLSYIWNDPETGEDVHVVAGSITDLVFGSGSDSTGVTDAELTISGLDLESGTTPISRLTGEVNLVASAFMHGPDEATPAEFAYVQALLGSYAQNFLGSSGADTYTGTMFGDTVHGNGGADLIKGGAGKDTVVGGGGSDNLHGQVGNDSLSGGTGADTLYGQGGNDTLTGGAGSDKLTGGAGSDALSGGAGADTFIFSAKTDSAGKTYDTIGDFTASDTIDLSAIDANSHKARNQAFDFIGGDDFSKSAGELRFERIKGETVIEADLNGDGKADFILHLDEAMTLRASHFDL